MNVSTALFSSAMALLVLRAPIARAQSGDPSASSEAASTDAASTTDTSSVGASTVDAPATSPSAGPETEDAARGEASSPLPSATATEGDFEIGFTASDGAYLRTRDRAWALRVGLLWQFRATFSSTPDPSREVELVPVLSRFYFQGSVAQPWIRYFAQVELAGQQNPYPVAPVPESPRLLDWWIEAQPHEAFGVRAGMMRPFFTRSWITGLQRMTLFDRTDANLFFRNHGVAIGGSMAGTTPAVPWDRDIGITLFGTPADGVVEYYVGVFNGNGFLLGRNEADSVMPMVRLALSPLGRVAYDETPAVSSPHQPFRLQLGIAGYYNHYRALYVDPTMTQQTGHEEQWTFGSDLTVQFESVYLSAEVYYRNRLTVDGARHDERGAMGIASWMFWAPYLEAALRFSLIDPSLAATADLRQVYDIGLNVYPAGNNLRLGVRYTASLNDAAFLGGSPGAVITVPAGTLVHSVGLWAQLYF